MSRRLEICRRLHIAKGTRAPKWTGDTVNPDVLKASYAVRGPVLDAAMKLEKRLEKGEKLPFDKVIHCNIGNPQSLKQQPLTFVRQVLSLVVNPALLETAKDKYPQDVIDRAKAYLAAQPAGAYSNSQGIKLVRDEVASFIERRDGYPSDAEQIFLTNGASEGVRYAMMSLLRGRLHGYKDGVLVPIPQYPLYSALATLLDGTLAPYYLHEESGWALQPSELQAALQSARDKGISVRGIVIINPGNPTGQVLLRENMENVINLCVKENLVLMADEVYQTNIYRDDREFISFKKVALDMGHLGGKGGDLQLVSFHSVSKGFLGECGFRGGYFELSGIGDGVKQQLYKLASISLCSNTMGQMVTGLMVNPPTPGSPSYDTYKKEKDLILSSLRRRALKLTKGLSSLEGVTCQPSDGAMYAFPQMVLPARFIDEAKQEGMAADLLYCIRMLEATGIVVVPGSGFGQRDGTWHFRTTFLPPEEEMDDVITRLQAYHSKFMAKYRA